MAGGKHVLCLRVKFDRPSMHRRLDQTQETKQGAEHLLPILAHVLALLDLAGKVPIWLAAEQRADLGFFENQCRF